MRLWLGPWVWNAPSIDSTYWAPPAGAVAALDLRSVQQCAMAGGAPQGVGLFGTPNAANLGGDYTNLGTDWDATLTAQQAGLLRSRLGLPLAIAAPRLAGALYEALTRQADPTGDDRAPPLLPTVGRRIEIHFAGVKVRDVAFDGDGAEAGPMYDLLKRAYRRIRQDALDGKSPPLLHRKALGYWSRKLGVPAAWLRPSDLPEESDLPPETSFTESWPADSSTISSGQDQSWTEVLNDSQVTGGRLAGASGATSRKRNRCETTLSGTDHYSQATITHLAADATRAVCVDVRWDASANTSYLYQILGNSGGESIQKCVAGTLTSLTSGARTNGLDPIYLEANGSSLQAKYNGSNSLSVTDSSITSGVRIGAGGIGTGSGWGLDSIVAADLAVGGGILYTQLERGVRGVARGIYTRF